MNQMLNGCERQMKIIASEYSDQIRISKTYFSHSGFWHTRDLAKDLTSESLENVISLSSWKLLNRGEHRKLIGEYGTESVRLKAAIKQAFPEARGKVKSRFFTDLENNTLKNSEDILKVKSIFEAMVKNKQFDKGLVKNSYSLLSTEVSPKFAEEVFQFIEGYDGHPANHFYKLRKFTDAMQGIFNKNQIQLKLIRTMMNQKVEEL